MSRRGYYIGHFYILLNLNLDFVFFISDSESEIAEINDNGRDGDVEILNEIFPSTSTSDIKLALNECNNDANQAVRQLLGKLHLM